MFTRKQRKALGVGLLIALDASVLVIATRLATYIRFNTSIVTLDYGYLSAELSYHALGFIFVAVEIAVLAFEGLYDLNRLEWGKGTTGGIVRVLAIGLVGFVFLAFAAKVPGISRVWMLLALVFASVFVVCTRMILIGVLSCFRARGHLVRRTLIVGTNKEACSIARVFSLRPEIGLRAVGFLFTSPELCVTEENRHLMPPVLGNARTLVSAVKEYNIDTVVLVSTAIDREILARMISELRHTGVAIQVSAGLFEIHSARIFISEMAGMPFMAIRGVSLARLNLIVKRVLDMLLSTLGIVVGLPVWLVLAAIICIESPGPVFYTQTRVGQNGKLFEMYKFRSMCVNADKRLAELREMNEATGPLFKIKDDPRLTRVGKWMRKFSIDEFPQLINVWKGEMSLVGPRPPLPHEAEEYTEMHWRRMDAPPGMTGLWQVSGRSALTFDDMVRLDVFYIENWSVGFDFEILFRTVPAVIFARGAC